MRVTWITLASSLAILGCATPPLPSETALKVQIHRQYSNLLDKCQRLGPITVSAEGTTGYVHTPMELATIAAEHAAREKTAEIGGDTSVFLQADVVSIQPGMPATAKVQVQALALKCN